MYSKRSSGRRPIRVSTRLCGALGLLGRQFDRGRVGLGRQGHPQQGPLRRVHRRRLQIARRHLAETLEAADLDLAAAVEGALQQLLAVRVVAGVMGDVALRQAVERRQRQEEMPVLDEPRHLAKEEGHQQRGDVGAVDIGVGHDDDPLVAQRLLAVMRSGAGAERQDDVRQLLVGAHLVGRRAGDVEDLAAQRQDRLGLAVARLLGRAAGAVALDEEDLGAGGAVAGAIGELAGQPQFARRRLARQLALLPPPLALLGALGDAIQQHPRGRRIAAEPMVEMVLDGTLDEPRRLGGGEPLLGLALKLRIADEQRQQRSRRPP